MWPLRCDGEIGSRLSRQRSLRAGTWSGSQERAAERTSSPSEQGAGLGARVTQRSLRQVPRGKLWQEPKRPAKTGSLRRPLVTASEVSPPPPSSPPPVPHHGHRLWRHPGRDRCGRRTLEGETSLFKPFYGHIVVPTLRNVLGGKKTRTITACVVMVVLQGFTLPPAGPLYPRDFSGLSRFTANPR